MMGEEQKSKLVPYPGHSGGIEIIKCNKENNTLEINEEVLRTLLLDPKIKDRYVSIISIAGAFRQGKSLLLNFLLFYLNVKYVKKVKSTHWLVPENGKIEGFHYKHGSQRDTEGILMWPEIFLATLEDGKEEAVILLDTQGAFDGQSSLEDCSTLFALSSIISSVQIYNLMRQIRADDLDYLEYFAGQSTFLDQSFTNFQKLVFLIRDWGFPYENPHGEEGGREYLDSKFSSDKHSPRTRAVVENLQNWYDNISCFLLPNPGSEVAETGKFQGNIKDLRSDFVDHVEALTETLLAPENLVLKQNNGELMKCSQLFDLIKTYTQIFSSGQIPKIRESYLDVMRDEFARKVEKDALELLQHLLEFGKLSGCHIPSRCKKIVTDYFQICLREKFPNTDLGEYKNQLDKKVELYQIKNDCEFSKSENRRKQFLENVKKARLFAFERALKHCYGCNYSPAKEGEIITETTNHGKDEFKARIDRYFSETCPEPTLVTISRAINEILAKNGNGEEVLKRECDRYKNTCSQTFQQMKLQWMDKWDNEMYEMVFAKVAAELSQEYNGQCQRHVDAVSWTDTERDFVKKFNDSTRSLKNRLLVRYERISVPQKSLHIKRTKREDLLMRLEQRSCSTVSSIRERLKDANVNTTLAVVGAAGAALGIGAMLFKMFASGSRSNANDSDRSEVAETGKFQGNIKDLRSDFVDHVEALTETLLAPENLVLKQNNGELMKCSQLFDLIKTYTQIFSSGQIPKIRESYLDVMRDEFARKVEKDALELLQHLLEFGKLSGCHLPSVCKKIVTDYFEICLQEKFPNTDLGEYKNQLFKKIELYQIKNDMEFQKSEQERNRYFENFIDKRLNSLQTMIKGIYSGNDYREREAAILAETTNSHSSQLRAHINHYLSQTCPKATVVKTSETMNKILAKIGQEVSKEKWVQYETSCCEAFKKIKDEWMDKWENAMYEMVFAKVASELNLEYNKECKSHVDAISWKDIEEKLVKKFNDSTGSLKTLLLTRYDSISVPNKFIHIKSTKREDLLQGWIQKSNETAQTIKTDLKTKGIAAVKTGLKVIGGTVATVSLAASGGAIAATAATAAAVVRGGVLLSGAVMSAYNTFT